VIFGLILALGSAVATNLAFLFKQRGAVLAPPISARHLVRSAAGLFRSKWFLIGWIVAVLAWGLHVGALALAPLSSCRRCFPAGSSSSPCSPNASSAFASGGGSGSA